MERKLPAFGRKTNNDMKTYLLLIFTTLLISMSASASNNDDPVQFLASGWQIQSSAKVSDSGEKISTQEFNTDGWISSSVPSTVLSALVKNGVYRDPYYGRNLETIARDPFLSPWWYRKQFDLDPAVRSDTVRLILDGINYSANIFMNGSQIASADLVSGAFRRFDIDISKLARKKDNVLAIEVIPPKPGNYTIGFVDWNPKPPDRNMGLWRGVSLHASGPVSIENPFVQTKLDLQSFKEAHLTISTTLVNHSDKEVSGKISGEIEGGIQFSQDYSLATGQSKEVQFNTENTPQLLVANPRVWWPNNLGNPELYSLQLTVTDQKGVSDKSNVTFGIREVADYKNEQGHRGYMVNGKKVLIRGGGWVDDLFLNEDEKNLESQFQYVKHLNLNTVRLEGFWGSSQKMYDLADRYGILIMAGFSCQWEWKNYLGKQTDEDYGGAVDKEDIDLLVSYLRDQVLWLRNHPSVFVWALASDKLPYPDLETRYREELSRIDPTRPALSSTKSWDSKISGPSAVKMNGPYEYVPPNYWYVDKENGGAFGFDTEVSPGAQPPPAESIQRMFSPENFWPVNDVWNFHCGRNEFNSMDRYMEAFNKRYGPAENLNDFARRSQATNYEGIRAMYEAFGVRKPVATGIVQWMLNAAWPKMFWQLYDYYLIPGGAFYGARKANEPLTISYDYSTSSIYVVNSTYKAYSDLEVEVKTLSEESKELFSKVVKASVGQNESKQILQLSQNKEAPVYFLSMKLKNGGKMIADNFYWLSAKQDVLDPEKTEWYFTPIKEYADFKALNKLAKATIQTETNVGKNELTVILKNPSKQIAFFIELRVIGDKSGRSIVPILWDDNYVSLLPGETRQLTARFAPEDLRGEKPIFQYSFWNDASEKEE
jgi:exo-1,4-beta-D-glucosaminidase